MVDDLLDGSARFAADLPVEALVLRFVTSTEAHARLERIATEAAAAVPGVVAVLTATTLPTVPIHEIALIPVEHAQPALAEGEVRFVGEQVVAVVAETAAIAADAAELVEIDYAPLPAVVDLAHATEAVLTWDEPAAAGAFATAEVCVRSSFSIPRVAVAPMEGRSVLAVPEPDGRLTLYASTQSPHWTRAQVSRSLDVPFHRLRVVTPHVGGGFGGKAVGGVPAYVVAAAAALQLRRPVLFVEPRADNLVTMPGRGLHFDVALHARRDGTIVGLEVDERCDAGAYPAAGSIEPGKTMLMAAGPYRVPAVSFRARSLRTNLAPTGAYRGPGRSEAAAVLERLLDLLARELALDPAEVRARNLLTARGAARHHGHRRPLRPGRPAGPARPALGEGGPLGVARRAGPTAGTGRSLPDRDRAGHRGRFHRLVRPAGRSAGAGAGVGSGAGGGGHGVGRAAPRRRLRHPCRRGPPRGRRRRRGWSRATPTPSTRAAAPRGPGRCSWRAAPSAGPP